MRSSTLCLLALVAVVLACTLFPAEARLREGECEGQCAGRRWQSSRLTCALFAVLVQLLTLLPAFVPVLAVCLKRMGEFSKSLGGLKDEEAIHNGIRKQCKAFTDKADKRFVRNQCTHTEGWMERARSSAMR